jgi:hypothetical protein
MIRAGASPGKQLSRGIERFGTTRLEPRSDCQLRPPLLRIRARLVAGGGVVTKIEYCSSGSERIELT